MPKLILLFFIILSPCIADDSAFIVNKKNARDKTRVKEYRVVNNKLSYKTCDSNVFQVVRSSEYKVIPSKMACQFHDFIGELERTINNKDKDIDIVEVCAVSQYAATEKDFNYKDIPVRFLTGKSESLSFVATNQQGQTILINSKGNSILIQPNKRTNPPSCNDVGIKRKIMFE